MKWIVFSLNVILNIFLKQMKTNHAWLLSRKQVSLTGKNIFAHV